MKISAFCCIFSVPKIFNDVHLVFKNIISSSSFLGGVSKKREVVYNHSEKGGINHSKFIYVKLQR